VAAELWQVSITFSFKSASLTGRETALGGGGGIEVSGMVMNTQLKTVSIN